MAVYQIYFREWTDVLCQIHISRICYVKGRFVVDIRLSVQHRYATEVYLSCVVDKEVSSVKTYQWIMCAYGTAIAAYDERAEQSDRGYHACAIYLALIEDEHGIFTYKDVQIVDIEPINAASFISRKCTMQFADIERTA